MLQTRLHADSRKSIRSDAASFSVRGVILERSTRALCEALALVVAVCVAVPIGGIIGIERSVEAAPVESVLRIGFMEKIESLNPYMGLSDASRIFYALVYDHLQAAGNGLESVPNLATEWRIVPTSDPELVISGEPYGSVWEFNLTQNARWTDGVPFTADDVAFNMNLNAENYSCLWAFQPYTYFMKHAEAIDADTVRIHFYDRATGDAKPVAYADMLTVPMLPKHLLESMDAVMIAFNWTGLFPSEDPPIVGTGPFMATASIFDEWTAGDHITLVRNPDYHGMLDYGNEVHFDKIVLRFYDDATAMAHALEYSQIDVAQFPPQTYRAIEQGVESGAIQNIVPFDGRRPDQYRTEVGINMKNAGPNPSRLDPLIRRAMAMASNKTFITQSFYLGLGEEGSTLVAPVDSFWHYEPNATEKIQYDLALANAMLEAAGYVDSDSDGIRECTASSYAVTHGLVPEGRELMYDMMVRLEHPEEKDIAMYLQDSWKQVGIQINYRVLNEASLAAAMYAYGYDTLIWYWRSDPDPNYILFPQSRAAWGGWSDNMYSNSSFEINYSMSVSELDRDQRKVYVDNCQRVHYLDVPYIVLTYENQTFAWRNDTFTGWGDWAASPGRSIENFWSANPLYFDLMPILPANRPPTSVMIDAAPNPALTGEEVVFNVSAVDEDGDGLGFYIDFGDGGASQANTSGGFTDPQYAEFRHAYPAAGTYVVTVWVDDGTGLAGHNVSSSCVVVVGEVIPEFTAALLPALGLVAVVAASRVVRRRRARVP